MKVMRLGSNSEANKETEIDNDNVDEAQAEDEPYLDDGG
jgi:hypothetical protein